MHCRHFSQCRFGDENTKPETRVYQLYTKPPRHFPLFTVFLSLIPRRSNDLCGVTQYQNDGISSQEHFPNLSASLHLLRPARPVMDHQDIGLDVRDESVLVYWLLPFSFWCLYPHLLIGQVNKASEGVERGDIIGRQAYRAIRTISIAIEGIATKSWRSTEEENTR